jgi:uncharacterized protein
MRRGGFYPAALERVRDRYPIITHGLTLSLGAIDEPDPQYLSDLKAHVTHWASPWHSDHLCFSTAGNRILHDLLPLKFCTENVERVAARTRKTEDLLGVPMAIENITWYAHPGKQHMSELEFILRVLEKSQAKLLLDVNNVYVNAQNHGFDARSFIEQLPLERVIQIHVAGHTRTETGMILDTHGTEVADPVLELLEWTLERTGPTAVLLERDNDVPELGELLREVSLLRTIYDRALERHEAHRAKSA